MLEIIPWWVTSDPSHPVNAARAMPQAPLMSEPEAPIEMPDMTNLPSRDPFPVPNMTPDAHPSTIPDNLIPKEVI